MRSPCSLPRLRGLQEPLRTRSPGGQTASSPILSRSELRTRTFPSALYIDPILTLIALSFRRPRSLRAPCPDLTGAVALASLHLQLHR